MARDFDAKAEAFLAFASDIGINATRQIVHGEVEISSTLQTRVLFVTVWFSKHNPLYDRGIGND